MTQQICKGALTARRPQKAAPEQELGLRGRPATFIMFCCKRTPPQRCCRSATSTPAPPPAAEAAAVRRRQAPLPKPAPAPPREPSPETAAPLVSPDDSPDEAQSPPRRMATVPRAPPPSPADAPYVMPPPPRTPPRTPPIAAPPSRQRSSGPAAEKYAPLIADPLVVLSPLSPFAEVDIDDDCDSPRKRRSRRWPRESSRRAIPEYDDAFATGAACLAFDVNGSPAAGRDEGCAVG